MGKLIVFLKYVFLVFSSDINESRKHIHVSNKQKGLGKLCKFWIEPEVELFYNYGFTLRELNEIENLILGHKEELDSQPDLFYEGKKVKSKRINE